VISRPLLLIPVLLPAALSAADVVPVPPGTEASASFTCEPEQGPEVLIDGDENSLLQAAPGTARPGQSVSVWLRFPRHLVGCAGIATGRAEPHHNYFAKRVEFWGDCDGNGSCETRLGASAAFGPAQASEGVHRFDGRPLRLFALEIRVVEQNIAGVKRAFSLSEVRLLADPKAPVLKP